MAALSRRARQHPELETDFQRAYRDVQNNSRAIAQHLHQHDMPQSQEALDNAQRQMDWMQQQIEPVTSSDQQFSTERSGSGALERIAATDG